MSSTAAEGLSVVVDRNQYPAEGADTVDAIITVETGAQFTAAAPVHERVEIIIDCSGSMGAGDRFAGARAATLAEPRTIASGLLGSVDVVKQGSQPTTDLRALTRASMRRTIPEPTLRIWTPVDATVRSVEQVAPGIEDLSVRRRGTAAQIGEYPLGAWGAEDRDYHVQVRLEPAAPGREKLAARIGVVPGDEVVGQGLVKAVWTTGSEVSARISHRVAHYTGRAELAEAVREGLSAREHGDEVTATAKLRRAVVSAAESGNDGTAKLLRTVVEVDEHTGTDRLRGGVDAFDEMALDARSTRTARVRKES